MREIGRSIVTAAKVQPLPGSVFDLHRDPAETAIPCRIRAVISKQVIEGCILAHLREDGLKIISIDECSSAGIRGQRNQSFL